MKIAKIKIHNFRGILDSTLDLFNYNLLVGPNNAGKSTVIDAIRAFYEKDSFKFRTDRDFPFIPTQSKESWIEISFKLEPSEDAALADDYRNTDLVLKVRKYFKNEDKNKEGTIFGYKTDGTISNEPFYGAKNVQSGKFGDIIFIPAVSKVEEHTKLSGPSALRDLLTKVLENVVESSPSFKKFSGDFDEFAQNIKDEETEAGWSLGGLEADLRALLSPWESDIKIEMKSPSIGEIIKTMLSYQCIDNAHGKALAAEQFGSGFQRHFIYSLIQIGSKYIGKKPSKKTKDFVPSMMLVLFEEPEAFLHPPQQEVLARNLMTLSRKPDQQTICSTHSTYFVSRNTALIPSITRLKREKGLISVNQIGRNEWDEIVDANQTLNSIAIKWPKLKSKLEEDDLKPVMESVKYFLWLNPDRCGLFFANHVLLVEGPSEQVLITKLLDDDKIKRPNCGLYVLDTIGKFNTHRFMNLLKALGIQHSVIHDDDKNVDYHAEINQLIQDSKSQFTMIVKTIPNDLEDFLSVPKTKDHRKPQHLLFLYESKVISEDKLNLFCRMVESCLPNH